MSVKVNKSPARKGPKTPKKDDHKKAEAKLSNKSKPALKQKKRAPLKNSAVAASKVARVAIASGKVTENEQQRKKAQDSRTLYLRFSEIFPSSVDQIKELHSDIKFVRTPRLSTKKDGQDSITYAFLEFSDEESCKSAKNKLATTHYQGKELYVDFVGEKSKNKNSGKEESQILNPMRLYVVGLAPGVTSVNLKDMFPKAVHADIPQKSKKKGTSFGFIKFSNVGDAKAAFDAAQDLSVNGHKITVLYAKTTEKKKEAQKRKAEKRKAKKGIEEKSISEKKIKVEKEKDSIEEESKVAEQTENIDNDEGGLDDIEESEKDDENLEDSVEEIKEKANEEEKNDNDELSDEEEKEERVEGSDGEEDDDNDNDDCEEEESGDEEQNCNAEEVEGKDDEDSGDEVDDD